MEVHLCGLRKMGANDSYGIFPHLLLLTFAHDIVAHLA